MASSWIITRATTSGAKRHRVEYRLGGRESATRYGGSFATKREALLRRQWIDGELAALRVPDLRLAAASSAVTVKAAAERWKASRVDVSPGTAQTYRVALGRIIPRLGSVAVDKIDAQTVADLVAKLHTAGLKKQTIRKTVSVLAMMLDHSGIQPNPARDKLTVRMPREGRRHLEPPTAEHVEAVVRLLPTRYRLPVLVLDATGMRVGELEALTWGDVDEPRGRWRVPMSASKTGRPRWVSPPPLLFEPVLALVPRDDRHPDRRVFDYMTSERLRTAIARACLHRKRRTRLLAAQPPPQARLAAAPCRDAVGADR